MAESGIATVTQDLIRVEVVYARPDEQVLLELEVVSGSTVGQVIERSGILDRFPEIGRTPARVGIFGRRASLGTTVREGERIEIYRPLIASAKEQRQAKARLRGARKPRRS